MTDTMTDDHLMGLALEEAIIAGAAGDVPVGAVIAIPDAGAEGGWKVIGRGRNRRELVGDVVRHEKGVVAQSFSALRDLAPVRRGSTAFRHDREAEVR